MSSYIAASMRRLYTSRISVVCFPFTKRIGMSINEGESTKNLKSALKIRATAGLSRFSNDTHGLKNGRQVAVRYYIEI